jgi:hypothetical protein
LLRDLKNPLQSNRLHAMPLPHIAYTSTLTLRQSVDQALGSPSVEVDLPASRHFWDFEGDLDEISSTSHNAGERGREARLAIWGRSSIESGGPEPNVFRIIAAGARSSACGE